MLYEMNTTKQNKTTDVACYQMHGEILKKTSPIFMRCVQLYVNRISFILFMKPLAFVPKMWDRLAAREESSKDSES